jgi:glycosyltransferase involved in cell wall biosynthesis
MISVIIPTYKTPEALDLCLDSAIKGQINNNQIIVVVDGFLDINRSVIEKYLNKILVVNIEQNVGTCRATNIGVYHAIYDKILIVNDDNVFPEKWDEILEKDYDPNSVLTPNQIEPFPSIFHQIHIHNMGRDPKTFDLLGFWNYAKDISKNLIDNNGCAFPFLISKINYLKIGGFDENYPSPSGFVSDWDFFLKCLLNNMKMIRSYKCHFYHFVSLSAKSKEQESKAQQYERLCHEYGRYKWGSYIKHNPINNQKYI